MSNPFDMFASDVAAAVPNVGPAPGAPADASPYGAPAPSQNGAPPPQPAMNPPPMMGQPPAPPMSGSMNGGPPPPMSMPPYGSAPPTPGGAPGQPPAAPGATMMAPPVQPAPFGAPPPPGHPAPFGAPPPPPPSNALVPSTAPSNPYALGGPPPAAGANPFAAAPTDGGIFGAGPPPPAPGGPAPYGAPGGPAPYGAPPAAPYDPVAPGAPPPMPPAAPPAPYGAPPAAPSVDPFGAAPAPPAVAADPFGGGAAAPPATAADPFGGGAPAPGPGALVPSTTPSDDPFGIFNSTPAPAAGAIVPAPAAPAPAAPAPGAPPVTDDPWADMGFGPPEPAAQQPPAVIDASQQHADASVLDTGSATAGQDKTKPGELPPGGEWYDARIFTPTLGVMFFKPQELTDSLFLQTERTIVDALEERPVVAFIVEGSSARAAGVELGHVLLKVNGIDVKNPKEASRLIKEGPRPLPLLFYVPDTSVVVAEGEHMVKYDTRDTGAPNSAKDWKPKYVVIGGIIAQPWMMNMYRSKSEYDIAVIETQARRPVSVKVKQFSLQGARIQNDWQGPQMVKYKNKLHPWKYIVVLPVARNPIKISSPNMSSLKPVHEGIRRVLMAQQRGGGGGYQPHTAAPVRQDPYARQGHGGGDPYARHGHPSGGGGDPYGHHGHHGHHGGGGGGDPYGGHGGGDPYARGGGGGGGDPYASGGGGGGGYHPQQGHYPPSQDMNGGNGSVRRSQPEF